DIMINSYALYQLSYCGMIKINNAWQRPTLTGPKVQLPSALRSLTAVFGMGTGVSFLLPSPHIVCYISNLLRSLKTEYQLVFSYLLNLNWFVVKSSTD